MGASPAQTTERLRVHQVVSENTQQTVIRGKITVPDPKPDVDKILSVDKSAKIKKLKIVPDKVIVEGTLNLQVIYVAFEPAQSVHHMHDQLPFTAAVEVPGAKPGMEVQGKVSVEDVNITRSRDDARKFDVAAVLSVFVKVTEIQEVDVLTQCPPGVTCKTELIKVAHVIGSKTKQVIVSDEFDVPQEKPAVDKILDVDVTAEIINKKVLKNKVIIDGTVTVEILYVGLEPDQPVHQLHRTFSFSDFLEVPGLEPDMDVRVEVKVEGSEVEQIRPDRLRADVILMLTANVFETKQINVITEVINAQADMVKLKIDHVVGEGSAQVILRDTFETPDPKPDVDKILDTRVEKVEVIEAKVIKNKVIVRGEVEVQIIYAALQPDQAVHAMHRKVSFHTFIEIPGAEESNEVDVRVATEYIMAKVDLNIINLEIVLKVTVKVIETLQKDVAIRIIPPAPPECVPGQVIRYTVQAGDTFYKLAQRYGTTLEAIVQTNPGVDPNQLQIGQIINIPCPPAKG